MSINIESLNENILTNRSKKPIISKSKKPNTTKLENKAKSKLPLHTINENDKNENNIKRKLFSKEDSTTKEKEKTNSTFSFESIKEKKEENKSKISYNMENLLINISLKEKNIFRKEEYLQIY